MGPHGLTDETDKASKRDIVLGRMHGSMSINDKRDECWSLYLAFIYLNCLGSLISCFSECSVRGCKNVVTPSSEPRVSVSTPFEVEYYILHYA